jgi:hypothetical protein
MDPTDPSVPALLTTEHSASSYHEGVLIISGTPYGPGGLPILLHPCVHRVIEERYQDAYHAPDDPGEADLCRAWNDAVSRLPIRLGSPQWVAAVNRAWRQILAAHRPHSDTTTPGRAP